MTQFSAGPLTGYTWGAVIAATGLLSLLLMGVTGRKRGLKAGTVPVSIPLTSQHSWPAAD